MSRLSDHRDHSAAWRDLTKRRWLLWGLFLSYVPGVGLLCTVIGRPLAALTGGDPCLWIGLCWLLAFMLAGIYLQRFRCPRCQEAFFQTRWWHNPFSRKCLHCGAWPGAARQETTP